MNTQRQVLAFCSALFTCGLLSANGSEVKFHPRPGSEPVVGHYLVTRGESIATDAAGRHWHYRLHGRRTTRSRRSMAVQPYRSVGFHLWL
jgi:hypothetical protein